MSAVNKFSVWQFFSDSGGERVCQCATAHEATIKAHQCCNSIGAKLGAVIRVRIMDADDWCNFEWRYGEGITFPAQPPLPPSPTWTLPAAWP